MGVLRQLDTRLVWGWGWRRWGVGRVKTEDRAAGTVRGKGMDKLPGSGLAPGSGDPGEGRSLGAMVGRWGDDLLFQGVWLKGRREVWWCPVTRVSRSAKQPRVPPQGPRPCRASEAPGSRSDRHWVAAFPCAWPHSPWHSVRAGLGWKPSSQSHWKLPAVLTQRPLAQSLGWAWHSSSSEMREVRQADGEGP